MAGRRDLGLNYRELGLRVGLEIHRQLDTRTKLFCDCPTEPRTTGRTVEFVRRLREAQSELGEVDPAARFEMRRARTIVYRADLGSVCLVEMDEEPPHELNREALRIALTFAAMVGARPVDEIQVMRKIVIDGSNTTGFQRTCIVAVGGSVRVGSKVVPIQTITLEEDAARLIEQRDGQVVYDLSRLGIPLIEVSTAPVIEDPREAYEVALAIGRLLRATGKVKRGIGTVRQDLNVSIAGSGLVEVKGVQELEDLPRVIEYEVRRLLHLERVRSELRSRGVRAESVSSEKVRDLTHVFSSSRSRLVSNALSKGWRVMGVRLPGFAGLLGGGDVRLGRELSEYARAWGGVEGILHSDELPGYGITQEEVAAVRRELSCGEGDAFVLVLGPERRCLDALGAVIERASLAVEVIPDETRAARPDGTTSYLRPRPGSARMYPETDVPFVRVSRDLLEEVMRSLPRPLEERAEELMRTYGLSRQLAWELIDGEVVEEFLSLVQTGVAPSFIASLLTEVMKDLRRQGVPVENVGVGAVRRYLELVAQGRTAKESARDVLAYLAGHPGSTVEEALKALGLEAPPLDEVERVVDELVREVLPRLSGRDPFGPIMGELMKRYRGRVDGAVLSRVLRERLARAGTSGGSA
ncbi:MAG: Glu-tRNA(Gln) amidotransferase subunit GatE [Nitrososphaerota archaeon]|nr:Glu-tRNA(Gln) amidotransferase subunit GatE [Candidatus Calditenuis fumarioli]